MVQGMRSEGHKIREIVRSPGLWPGPHWGSLLALPYRPLAGGWGYNLLPKNPTLLALRSLRASLLSPPAITPGILKNPGSAPGRCDIVVNGGNPVKR